MTPSILVTGGTGTLGRHVTPLLRDAGRELRVLSRRPHPSEDGMTYVTGDLATGEGIEAAVAGVETVLHLAGGPKGDDAAARTLVRAAARADVRHLVHISVIGADRMPLGWFRSKLGAERAVVDSGVPWTVLRAAQFHDLVLTMVGKMTRLPLVPAPGGLRFEPVDAAAVANRLAALTLGEPAGLVPDLAGPKVYDMAELSRGYLRARDRRRPLLPVRIPGRVGKAYRAGENLSPNAERSGRTWEDFLAERLDRPVARRA
ncbi:SDR family oxidoreductase [Streptomyces sp. B6B3]|uniref:SDR family oxidoreductase n=1 Tax=Streptomyces sp. B6B3 TaxID=3153570 RepID=UPI00325D4268